MKTLLLYGLQFPNSRSWWGGYFFILGIAIFLICVIINLQS